tara:strand:- start:2426 stop:2854 length:429 start_codon:yes stop_codon:yes gene_type:complete
MAHFAKIDLNNNVVDCIVVHDSVAATEIDGQNFIANILKKEGTWLQTSYNTKADVHQLGGTPLRGNFGTKGSTWDPILEIFMPEKPYTSWVMSNSASKWTSPIGDQPSFTSEQQEQNTAGTHDWLYYWDEDALTWNLFNTLA